MERRKFGDTDLEVSAIALGCWIFGVDWWGHYTQADCDRLCSFSLDLGVTFFDNACVRRTCRALSAACVRSTCVPCARYPENGLIELMPYTRYRLFVPPR